MDDQEYEEEIINDENEKLLNLYDELNEYCMNNHLPLFNDIKTFCLIKNFLNIK